MACARSRTASAFSIPSVRLTVGETDPPACGLRINLYRMANNRRDHVPFLGRHLEVNAGAKVFVTGLFFGLNPFQDLRCLIEHSQLKIPARSMDMALPIGFQGIGDSWSKKKRAFAATHVSGRKAPAVKASM